MGITKQDLILQPTSCLNKASFDEPVFLLRANDPIAPAIVRLWVDGAVNTHEGQKLEEALLIADRMLAWRQENTAHAVNAPAPLPATYTTRDVDEPPSALLRRR